MVCVFKEKRNPLHCGVILDSLWSSEAEPGAGSEVAPPQRMAEPPSLPPSAWGWGLLPICRFNNGNLHFTNERINSQEIVFLATVALCFKGVGFL